MTKVKAKAPFFNNGKLYKKGDVLEIETASFNPIYMSEIPEARTAKTTASEKPVRKTRKTAKE